MRVLLVEDDELFRLGLSVRLQREPNLSLAEAPDGETAIDLVRHQPFDLVLLDLGLPGIGGIEACRQMSQLQPGLPVLALTSRTEPGPIVRAIAAGVRGYCLKGIAAETLILAMRSVAAGASWWDGLATEQIRVAVAGGNTTGDPADRADQADPADRPGHRNHAPIAAALATLTQREREILKLMSSGQTNLEIARSLYISPGTVRVHVHAILQKLGARDRTQAVVLALEAGG